MKEFKIKGKIETNVPLKQLTTYKLEGIAKYVIYPNDEEELIKIIKDLKSQNKKYKIVGGCSNLIFKGDYNGYLVKLDKLDSLKIDENKIIVGSGYSTMRLAYKVSRLGLTGLEFATGIPGTIGGAIFNNAGAYGSDMGYVVESIKVITPDLEIKTMYNKELDFHYRTSFLKKNKDYICLEATIILKKGNKENIMDIIEDRKQRRMMSQPLEYPSAGSVFRNPDVDSAWKLIEGIDYKGKTLGGAKVSEKHANFIINYNHATGEDIIKLIEEIKTKVKEKYNVDLILEQEIVE